MLGDIFSSPRDMAVNESAQQRVSDSGAIRSGLVPRQHGRYRQAIPCMPRTEGPGGLWLNRAYAPRTYAGPISDTVSHAGEGADARGDSGEAETDPVFFRCHGERGRATSIRGPVFFPIASGRNAIICAAVELPMVTATNPHRDHANGVPFPSNDGFEIGVCPTRWKRVSWLSEMHARLRAPA
jgi:hypothetical protein